jgi:hypothetical protein
MASRRAVLVGGVAVCIVSTSPKTSFVLGALWRAWTALFEWRCGLHVGGGPQLA